MKGRQCMMPVKRFPDHNPFKTLLQYCLESGPCRGTIIDYKNTDQANSFKCRSSEVVTEPYYISRSLCRWTPYPGDLTAVRIG